MQDNSKRLGRAAINSSPRPSKDRVHFFATLLIAVIATACASPDNPDRNSAESASAPPTMSREESLELRRQMVDKKGLVPVESDKAEPVTGEVPGTLLERIIADLERRTGGAASEFALKRAEAVQWNDGALGCAKPGDVYTQAIVPGYRVVLEHKGKEYHYHAAERGYFVLCEDLRAILDEARGNKQGPRDGAPVE